MKRRDVLTAGLALPALAVGSPAIGQSGPAAADPSNPRPALPDLGFLRDQSLLNADRARYFMQMEGLDALVVAQPANVYYLSNHWPQLDRMGLSETMLAIWPREEQKPLALVMHAFSWYYTHSPESGFAGRVVYPYTNPADPAVQDLDRGSQAEPAAAPARGYPVVNPDWLTGREAMRQSALDSARPAAADPSWALARALNELGLQDAVLGIDHAAIDGAIRRRGLPAELRPAENTLRRIRLVKSAPELQLMKLAAQQNLEAAMGAAQRCRELRGTQALRSEFYAEAARRGNLGVFMVINGSSAEVIDEPLEEGMAFSIDCVSSLRFYHGDFARTVFIGEPRPEMRRTCEIIATAWQEIREQLRPGLDFADIPRIGSEVVKQQGANFRVSFRPHSVGLFHTDHPQPSLLEPRSEMELKLEEGMILSVDCPVMAAGLGGSAHLEDLMHITASGAEPIHDVPHGVIVV